MLSHTHSQDTGGYLIFDGSNISLLSIINGVRDFAFPVGDIAGVITAGTRGGHFESSHLLKHLVTGLGRRRKRPGISREPRQTGQVSQKLRLNSPCPPSGSWPVHMYGRQERPQDYGWKYASGFFPKLNAERSRPPKQSMFSTAQTVPVCSSVYNVVGVWGEEIKVTIMQSTQSSRGSDHGVIKHVERNKQIQKNRMQRSGEMYRRVAYGLIALI